jgi:hypothetical protein
VVSLLRDSILTSNDSVQKFVVLAGMAMGVPGVNKTWFGRTSPALCEAVKPVKQLDVRFP